MLTTANKKSTNLFLTHNALINIKKIFFLFLNKTIILYSCLNQKMFLILNGFYSLTIFISHRSKGYTFVYTLMKY